MYSKCLFESELFIKYIFIRNEIRVLQKLYGRHEGKARISSSYQITMLATFWKDFFEPEGKKEVIKLFDF